MRIAASFLLASPLAVLALAGPGCSPGRVPADRDVGPGLDAPLPPGVDGGPGTDAPLPPGVDGGPGTDAPLPPGVDGGPGTDAPPVTPAAYCRLGCTTSSDCTTASAAFDADNYACAGGACVYSGCLTDAECRSSFSDARYVCRDLGTGTRACTLGCVTAGDCTTASAAFDADNYTCESGACRYQGCNDDAECASSFADSRYVCRAVMAAPILPLPTGARNCVLGCAASADCTTASAAFDADNYACTGGACVYSGCNDDAECRSSFSDARYACR